ncbi:XTP/dITP diphosphatase [Ferviditalea candida]|uniref:dITP/XTP pyrophosphatase n=1 Tax=Ferviditalea candida TaxID=3108399 RepID=A0ABU5ZD37_9BACL|nr:XTP/dITP diphosphatase [Paenibacillaceae bacterium T2]
MRLIRDTLVIATRNKGKVKEFAELFEEFGINVRSLNDFENVPEIVEDGATFAENALKKATAVASVLHLPVLADDSGLTVDLLDGKPGVFSARFAGEKATDQMNNEKLIAELRKQTERRGLRNSAPYLSPAQFVCVLALYNPERNEAMQAEGRCEGFIVEKPRGSLGFGYDPLFYLPEVGKTMAELDTHEKNRISHRARALRKLLDKLRS